MRKNTDTYLKTIFECSFAKKDTTNKQIAMFMGVSPASVTGAITTLEKQGLVHRRPYGGISLTTTGRQKIIKLIWRYRLCEVWLVEKFNLPLNKVPEQAWLMAGFNSQELDDQFVEALGSPQVSPFGGSLNINEMLATDLKPLNSFEPSDETILVNSYLETASSVSYIEHMGLPLNTPLQLTQRDTATNTLLLLDQDNQEYLVNTEIAHYIYAKFASVPAKI